MCRRRRNADGLGCGRQQHRQGLISLIVAAVEEKRQEKKAITASQNQNMMQQGWANEQQYTWEGSGRNIKQDGDIRMADQKTAGKMDDAVIPPPSYQQVMKN